jgi:hypothetical protein
MAWNAGAKSGFGLDGSRPRERPGARAGATYVLIAILKKELHIDASLYICLQILSVSVFEKTEVSCAFRPDRPQRELGTAANQLILFDF